MNKERQRSLLRNLFLSCVPRRRNKFQESLRIEFFRGRKCSPASVFFSAQSSFSHSPSLCLSTPSTLWPSHTRLLPGTFLASYMMFPSLKTHSPHSPKWLRSASLKSQNSCLLLLESFPDSLLGFAHTSIMIPFRLYYNLFISNSSL